MKNEHFFGGHTERGKVKIIDVFTHLTEIRLRLLTAGIEANFDVLFCKYLFHYIFPNFRLSSRVADPGRYPDPI